MLLTTLGYAFGMSVPLVVVLVFNYLAKKEKNHE